MCFSSNPQACGLTLALTRLTYDLRFTTTAEAIVLKDSDGIRVLSLGFAAASDEDIGQRSGNGDDVDDGPPETPKKMPHSSKVSALRRQRQARREQERDSTNPKEKIEAAAAAMAENQKRETSALFVSFIACDKR